MEQSIKRIIIDYKELQRNPIDGIYFSLNEENIYNGYAMIIGPPDTPYEHGFYFFEFNFTKTYPYEPPKVLFMTNDGMTRFNPNFYRNGKVCLSILNTWAGDSWSACQSLSSILLTLRTTMNEEPLLNEPGINKIIHQNYIDRYNEIITYQNINFAIHFQLVMYQSFLPNFMVLYHEIMKDYYMKHKDDIMKKVMEHTKMEKFKSPYPYNTNLYKLNSVIDYNALLEKLELMNTKFQ